jgi:thiamine-phosphate pyrophosphorylase
MTAPPARDVDGLPPDPTAAGTPSVVVVTDRALAGGAGHTLVSALAAALTAGASRLLLREKDLPLAERSRLADDLRALTAAHGAELWVASDPALAADVGADGIHLAAADPWPKAAEPTAETTSRHRNGWSATTSVPGRARPGPTGRRLMIGRSCHTLADLRAARDAGADRVTYSPVFATASKPGYGPALGLDGLAAGCRAVPGLPVIALGGVEPGRARACVEAGAAGVALMGAVMRAGDPAAVVRSVVDELTGVGA